MKRVLRGLLLTIMLLIGLAVTGWFFLPPSQRIALKNEAEQRLGIETGERPTWQNVAERFNELSEAQRQLDEALAERSGEARGSDEEPPTR